MPARVLRIPSLCVICIIPIVRNALDQVLREGVDRGKLAHPAVCCHGTLMNVSSIDLFSTVLALITAYINANALGASCLR